MVMTFDRGRQSTLMFLAAMKETLPIPQMSVRTLVSHGRYSRLPFSKVLGPGDRDAIERALDAYQDRGAVENKEHIGYIVDRTGFEEFLKFIMKDVHLNPKAEMNGRPYWGGKHYDTTNELRSSMYRFSDRPHDGYTPIPREDA